MINRFIILLIAIPLLVSAEESSEVPRKEGKFRGAEHRQGDGRVFHFMQRLKDKDPAMFEELSKLRSENMEKFREVIKERMQNSIKEHGEFKRPKGKGPGGDRHWLRELHEKNPERYAELMKLREEDPGKFRSEMAKEFGDRMKKKPMMNKETMEEIRQLAQEYHKAEEGDKEQLKGSLKKALVDSFSEDLENRRQMAERLEKHLAEIKSQISEREKSMSQMVEKKLKMLINEDAFKGTKQKKK